jgi:hypothetical protein
VISRMPVPLSEGDQPSSFGIVLATGFEPVASSVSRKRSTAEPSEHVPASRGMNGSRTQSASRSPPKRSRTSNPATSQMEGHGRLSSL